MVLPLTCALPASTRTPLLSVTCTELKDGSRPCVKDSVTWRGAAPTDPPTGGLALASMACACAPPLAVTASRMDATKICVRMVRSSRIGFVGCRRYAADQRLPVALGEDVVEIEMELPEKTDAGAAVAIDWNHRLKADLEIAPDPDHARIDRAGRDKAVAKVVRDRG